MTTRTRPWGDFKRWCQLRGLKSLPAHPWTIAAYLRWVERRKDAPAAREALRAISREHLLGTLRVPTRHPVVERTLEMIERRAGVRDRHADLFDDDVLAAEAAQTPSARPAPRASRPHVLLTAAPKLVRRRPAAKS